MSARHPQCPREFAPCRAAPRAPARSLRRKAPFERHDFATSLAIAATLVAATAFNPRSASAQAPSEAAVTRTDAPADAARADRARLPTLTLTDREALGPLLERGPVALVEFAPGDELPAIVFAAMVDAPAETLAAVVADPAGYPHFMGVLDSVRVTARHPGQVAYDWTWRTAMFELRGSNAMTIVPPPDSRPQEGWRFGVQATGGDLGTGRMLWRVVPTGDRGSLLTLSMRLDLRDANYLARQMSAASRTVNRSVNVALGYVMVLGARAEAQRRAGVGEQRRPTRAADALAPADLDLARLAPVLARGDLIGLELEGGRLARAIAIGRTGTGADVVLPVVSDPTAFGTALMPGGHARVTATEVRGGETTFDWEVALPIVGTSGRMHLSRVDPRGHVVEVRGISGALDRGRWRFETHVQRWGEAVVVGIGAFDPADTSWLVRAVVGSSPDFGAGLAGAMQLMVVRAIRNRALETLDQRTPPRVTAPSRASTNASSTTSSSRVAEGASKSTSRKTSSTTARRPRAP
jgi:hypothetical protein